MESYKSLVAPLLRALEWRGTPRTLADIFPPGIHDIDRQQFRDIMARLGFSSIERAGGPALLTKGEFPCIFVDKDNRQALISTPEEGATIKAEGGFCIIFRNHSVADETTPLRIQLRRFSPLVGEIFLLSMVIGVVALAPMLFNRVIYDHVIASGTTKGMNIFCAGVVLALAAEVYLRHMRTRRLAFFGGRLDHFVSCSVFERLFYLPPLYTERASVSAQLARLRDFENVREFFTGPLATLFFEMPLIVIYLLIMGWMSQWLVLVPICLVLAYALMLMMVNGRLREKSAAAATLATQRQEFLLETVTKLKSIRLAGMETAWMERYRKLSGAASLSAFNSQFAAQGLETAAYVLMTFAAVATLGFGVVAVIQQSLTVGGLVAAMMLIWRINAPLQICCASISRIQQLAASTRQVSRLLGLTPERSPYASESALPQVKGRITFHRATLRYSAEMEAALLGVSFDIKPGQVVAVRGGNGSGKSTLLKTILGLYPPQNGSVRIDGIDIRQFDPVALRQMISYVPQSADLFPGTILENLLMAAPLATHEDIDAALTLAKAKEEIDNLPAGLLTMVEGGQAASIPFMLRQRINLARAYLRPAPIMLFDEASYSLGIENDNAFAAKVASLRGRSTVVIVTHREDHMRLADTLLVLDRGELTHAGPPDQVLAVMRGKRA